MLFTRSIAAMFSTLLLGIAAHAAPNFVESIDRPLRYRPDGTDFVRIDGPERFNRPLYGGGTAFRVDAGDRPTFSLFLPGRGGVLRLGVRQGGRAIWLDEAAHVESRYRPGSMRYAIHDPLLGDAEVRVVAIVSFADEALLARVEVAGASDGVELIAAYGGANGDRGSRDGDIGTERVPVGEFFALRPEHCVGNRITIDADGFTLASNPATLVGRASMAMRWSVGDAARWASPGELLASTASETPVVVGSAALASPIVLRVGRESKLTADLATQFDDAERARAAIAGRLKIDTPDAFLNAACAAMNVAAEGTWDDKQQAVMHGAVAWRVKLLGWRGPYWPDEIGLHDRTSAHLANWFGKQNDDAIPATLPAAEASANGSRNETALHSNGDLSNSHYDMNVVAIDALFRHLLWTGDVDYARSVWPIIERHLAWERRLFRRDFADGPLYEAYCCIWASDDLAYNGGGATHASAYNAYHNRMAARVARWIGVDGSAYDREADAIERAIRSQLWLPDVGHHAEWRDWLGDRLAHPDAAAWTVYHAIDSQVTTPAESWQLARYAATSLPHVPIRGDGVPTGAMQIATSDWMPYQWSTNNVVMAETAHASLAMFQAGRREDAIALLRGSVLDSMYLGLCPGNVGMCTPLDMARGESQRDFADGCGALSRAIVEGLFGIAPDAIAGTLTLRPAFPADWMRASIDHADVKFAFARDGDVDTCAITSRFQRPMRVRLEIAARRNAPPAVTVDGRPTQVAIDEQSIGTPTLLVTIEPSGVEQTVRVAWAGEPIAPTPTERIVAVGEAARVAFGGVTIDGVDDPQSIADAWTIDGEAVRFAPRPPLGHRTAFARVHRGAMRWRMPIELDVREPIELIASIDPPPGRLVFALVNNGIHAIAGEATIDAGATTTRALDLTPSSRVTIDLAATRAGTQPIIVRVGDRVIARGSATNWRIDPPTTSAQEPVAIDGAFNDRVSQIFKHQYLSPRSPFCSLATPTQGIGSWCKPTRQYDVDDNGLRRLPGGRLTLPNGVAFVTPTAADAKNVLFVSRWDVFPRDATVPLSGRASHAYLLMAGSTNSMQSRFDNGEVIATYADGTSARLALRNPETWWPIDQDYAIDDFAFRFDAVAPPRVDLKTALVRVMDRATARGKGRMLDGGAATVLDLPLDATKELRSLTVRAIANEVVIGLMAVTLDRGGVPAKL